MNVFAPVCLQVWKAIGEHLDLSVSIRVIADVLKHEFPLHSIQVWRPVPDRTGLECIAISTHEETESGKAEMLTMDDVEKAYDWIVNEAQQYAQEKPRFLKVAAPQHKANQIALAMLGGSLNPDGAVCCLVRTDRRFSERQRELFQELIPPFTAALQTAHRIQEIETLRAASESKTLSLLRRLGREDMQDAVIGADGGLKPVMERVALVAPSDAPVLLLGETGTGKEVIAREIHTHSPRRDRAFLRINCGALPPDLIDSELFGHERGAFTGAATQRKGWFERADTGTLFLDEIGDLPLAAQVRLLRVLQDGWMERVGGTKSVHVNVRIVAATHRDLSRMVREETFREDLWYRLSVFPIEIPPLRDRLQDMELLAHHFARRSSLRLGLPCVSPSKEDIAYLSQYDWPGNVRELASVIDRAAILGEGAYLSLIHI